MAAGREVLRLPAGGAHMSGIQGAAACSRWPTATGACLLGDTLRRAIPRATSVAPTTASPTMSGPVLASWSNADRSSTVALPADVATSRASSAPEMVDIPVKLRTRSCGTCPHPNSLRAGHSSVACVPVVEVPERPLAAYLPRGRRRCGSRETAHAGAWRWRWR